MLLHSLIKKITRAISTSHPDYMAIKRYVDSDFYRVAYPDVAQKNADPVMHYLNSGWLEGRNPSSIFNTIWYLHTYKDIACHANPLVNFARIGKHERRPTSPTAEDDRAGWMTKAASNELLPPAAREYIACYDLIAGSGMFDEEFYRLNYPEVQTDALEYFIRNGWRAGHHPCSNFDTEGYLREYDDVRESGINPLIHYLRHGKQEGRTPKPIDCDAWWRFDARRHQKKAIVAREKLTPRKITSGMLDESGLFDADWYLKTYHDVERAGVDPRAHFLESGSAELRSPGPGFDSKWYCKCYPDVLREGYEPLVHYIEVGRFEKRDPTPPTEHYTCSYELSAAGPISGVVPARRPDDNHDYSVEVPFAYVPYVDADRRVAAFIHVFYPDLLEGILRYIENVPCRVDIFASTNTIEKKSVIEAVLERWAKGKTEVRLTENKGRDIAAMIVGFSDVFAKYDIFFHLHTKKSPHAGDLLFGWRDYLLQTLLGSETIARSIISLFDDPKIGVVFPQHFFEVRKMLNWGFDYDLARDLLARIGVSLSKDLVLEFPSGSMFWGRTEALRPLLDLNLQFSDFPEEAGQIDGTLAHAIERSLLMVAESKGYEWLKVARRDLYPLSGTILQATESADLDKHRLLVYQPCLSRADATVSFERFGMPETRLLLSYPSRNETPRINLIIPSINPREAYGGISTAIKLFEELSSELAGDFDRRIIVTDSRVSYESLGRWRDYVETPYFPSLDKNAAEIVDASDRARGRLNLRVGDIFIATAWWTARFALDLGKDQKRYFGKKLPFIYFIQDDEPYFYGWSSKWALAEATYRFGRDTIAIINSEELYLEISRKYNFSSTFCYKYQLNDVISQRLSPEARERLILVYARPHAQRNAFELICEALKEWQQRDPVAARKWQIICLGEEFEKDITNPVQNISVMGKVSLESYANYLNRASVGISLMLSPHPSYPPLEMAEAGLVTITNSYGTKNLARRFPEMISLDFAEVENLAQAVELAVKRAEPFIGRQIGRRVAQEVVLTKANDYYSSSKVAELLKEKIDVMRP